MKNRIISWFKRICTPMRIKITAAVLAGVILCTGGYLMIRHFVAKKVPEKVLSITPPHPQSGNAFS